MLVNKPHMKIHYYSFSQIIFFFKFLQQSSEKDIILSILQIRRENWGSEKVRN